jgi:hypothetical protein
VDRSSDDDGARATYALIRAIAPVLVLLGVVLWLLGVITALNAVVSCLGLIVVFTLATWRLRRPVRR